MDTDYSAVIQHSPCYSASYLQAPLQPSSPVTATAGRRSFEAVVPFRLVRLLFCLALVLISRDESDLFSSHRRTEDGTDCDVETGRRRKGGLRRGGGSRKAPDPPVIICISHIHRASPVLVARWRAAALNVVNEKKEANRSSTLHNSSTGPVQLGRGL